MPIRGLLYFNVSFFEILICILNLINILSIDTLGDRLCAAWEEEKQLRAASKQSPRLKIVLLRVFGWHLFVTGILLCIKEFLAKYVDYVTALLSVYYTFISRVSQPICLFGVMAYFSGDDPDPIKAKLYGAALIAAALISIVFGHPLMLGIMHLAMRMRVALCSLIYRKSLRLSRTGLLDTSIGHIVNLMSNDVGRFDSVLANIHYIWLGPLELFVVTYLMYEKASGSVY